MDTSAQDGLFEESLVDGRGDGGGAVAGGVAAAESFGPVRPVTVSEELDLARFRKHPESGHRRTLKEVPPSHGDSDRPRPESRNVKAEHTDRR